MMCEYSTNLMIAATCSCVMSSWWIRTSCRSASPIGSSIWACARSVLVVPKKCMKLWRCTTFAMSHRQDTNMPSRRDITWVATPSLPCQFEMPMDRTNAFTASDHGSSRSIRSPIDDDCANDLDIEPRRDVGTNSAWPCQARGDEICAGVAGGARAAVVEIDAISCCGFWKVFEITNVLSIQ